VSRIVTALGKLSRAVNAFCDVFRSCSSQFFAVLGFFSIQEKAIFYTRYHYISSYIVIISLCIMCIIIVYLIYHVPRRHMIYRLYHRFSFVMLYHVISCRVFDDTWTWYRHMI
jgi:hypothetical protein